MDTVRLEALLESVRAVQESVSRLEREIMVALAKDNDWDLRPSPIPEATGEWFTLAELGAWLKVSRATVYRIVSTKEIASYRIGRSVRVRRADVEMWLELHRGTPNE